MDAEVLEFKFQANNPGWVFPIARWIYDLEPLPEGLPFPDHLKHDAKIHVPDFGKTMKKEHFILDDSFAFLNHGSYGATLKLCLETQDFYRHRMDLQPIRFMEKEVLPLLTLAAKKVAALVGASPKDLVFVPNATTAVNAVAHSLLHPNNPSPINKDSVILAFDIGYPACHSALAYVCDIVGAKLVKIRVPYPYTEQKLIDNVQQCLDKYGKRVRLVMLDHITSMPPIIIPIEKLTPLIRAHSRKHQTDVEILVDGAHSIGGIELDLEKLDVDYFTSNLHKWLCCPKGCAILWTRRDRQPFLVPTVISHGYTAGYLAEFYWSATFDYTAYIASLSAVKFFETVGLTKIMRYNHQMLEWACDMLSKSWGTKALYDTKLCATTAVIEIPKGTYGIDQGGNLHEVLRDCFKVEVPISTYHGMLIARISCQIYSDKEDFVRFAQAITAIQKGQNFLGLSASSQKLSKL